MDNLIYWPQSIWTHMLSYTMWQHYTAHRYLRHNTYFKLHTLTFIIRSFDLFDKQVFVLFSKMIAKNLKDVNIKKKFTNTKSKEHHVIRYINIVSFSAINNICIYNSFKTNCNTYWPRHKVMEINMLLLREKNMVLCVQITARKKGKKGQIIH